MGKSSIEELHKNLEQLPFVDANSIQEYNAATSSQDDDKITSVDWDCLHPRVRSCGNARLSENKLISLWMYVNYELNFADVVQKFGPPTYVGYRSIDWEGTCEVSLYWADKGISIGGDKLIKACPTAEEAQKEQGPNRNIKITSVYIGVPDTFHFDSTFPEYYVPWRGFDESPFSFLDFVPGDSTMWLVALGSIAVLVVVALWKPRWPSPLVGFPLAGIATFLPTLQFQFSDLCVPTIIAYAFNTFACGFGYVAIAEGVRAAWRHIRYKISADGALDHG